MYVCTTVHMYVHVIASSGAMDPDVDRRVAQASRAFCALRKAIFLDKDLTLTTKRKVYQACVLSILLYGAECWTLLRRHTRNFHHRCIRIILGISNHEQWTKRITMHEIKRKWGDDDTAEIKVAKRRLQWLGHLARMSDHRLPKVALFSWFSEPRPRCGPKKRWRDAVRKDLRVIEVNEDKCYDETVTSRASWRALCRDGLESSNRTNTEDLSVPSNMRVVCERCQRTFRRESDKKRHKCVDERAKPVHEQRGAVKCNTCNRWSRSKGGLSVHACRPGDAT